MTKPCKSSSGMILAGDTRGSEKTPAESRHWWDPGLSIPSRTLPRRLLSPGEAPRLKEEGPRV